MSTLHSLHELVVVVDDVRVRRFGYFVSMEIVTFVDILVFAVTHVFLAYEEGAKHDAGWHEVLASCNVVVVVVVEVAVVNSLVV